MSNNTPTLSVINCFQNNIKERQERIQHMKTQLKNEEDNLETMIATFRELEEYKQRSMMIKKNNDQSALRIRFHIFLDSKLICPAVRENIKSSIIFFPESTILEEKLLMETHFSHTQGYNNSPNLYVKLTMNTYGDNQILFTFGKQTNSEIYQGCDGTFIIQEESMMFENIAKHSILFE